MKKRRIIFGCLIGVLILIIGGISYQYYKKKQENQPSESIRATWYTYSMAEITGIDWLHDGKWLAVSWKHPKEATTTYKKNERFIDSTSRPIIGLKKIILTKSQKCMYSLGDTPNYSTKWLLDIYTIKNDSMEKEKQIDLEAKVKEINEDYSVISVQHLYGDEEFLLVKVLNKKEIIHYYLHLSDESLLQPSEMDPEILEKSEEEYKVPEEYWYLRSTNFLDRKIVSDNELSTLGINGKDGIEWSPRKKQTASISNLQETYPFIKKSIERKEFGILNYSQDPPSAEEVAELLVPNGKNPWEGVILEADDSKDGKEHKIGSVEEFLTWYQEYKPEKKE